MLIPVLCSSTPCDRLLNEKILLNFNRKESPFVTTLRYFRSVTYVAFTWKLFSRKLFSHKGQRIKHLAVSHAYNKLFMAQACTVILEQYFTVFTGLWRSVDMRGLQNECSLLHTSADDLFYDK